MNADVVVVGGGLVGSAIAFGLTGSGMKVALIDGDDRDFRASNANGGLVWLHGKGVGLTPYHRLTRQSVDLWPAFRDELRDLTGIDVKLVQEGGLHLCLGEDEYEQRAARLMRLHNQIGDNDPDYEMLDRNALNKLVPKVTFGPDVSGASFGRLDGFANPLLLLSALHQGIIRRGGKIHAGQPAHSVQAAGTNGFIVSFGDKKMAASRVVIAAGLGTESLAAQVGISVPTKPLRGQILITERMEPFLPLPMLGLAQMPEGTVMIGTTHEDAGLDTSTTADAAASMSAVAVRWVPAIAHAKLVRQWSGLRIMTPDGFPIYAESETHPGAFVATCHSGVSLAAVHAHSVAKSIADGRMAPFFDIFHQRRFDVPSAA